LCVVSGGIAEMAELDPYVREKTDALDAAGNTTAAIGKGFAIGSAALVSLALFGAFVTRIRRSSDDALFASGVNMLEPLTFAFLIVGGMIPFAFAAMTMKSVGEAAMAMVLEVQRQFDEKPHLLDANPTERPDYDACIAISTQASLREMVPPAAMVIFTPLLTGIFFGVSAISGLLVGALIASVQLAISMSNSGGAWDNAKKYIEKVRQPNNSMSSALDRPIANSCSSVSFVLGCSGQRVGRKGIGHPQGRRRWRHCRRPVQGHVGSRLEHCHEAYGGPFTGVCRHLLCH
jgi:H+-translocating diphosphatase